MSRFIELSPNRRGKPLIINGVRYIRCRVCAELKTTYEFLVYGGQGLDINLGLCRVCAYKK